MLKVGQRYCVADLVIQSHGMIAHDGRGYPREVLDMDIDFRGLEVRKPDFIIPLDKIGTMWLNTEARNKLQSWYLVYPADMGEQEFQALFKDECMKVVEIHLKMYEILLDNTRQMLDAIHLDKWKDGPVKGKSFMCERGGHEQSN